jgi:hypothetical protein
MVVTPLKTFTEEQNPPNSLGSGQILLNTQLRSWCQGYVGCLRRHAEYMKCRILFSSSPSFWLQRPKIVSTLHRHRPSRYAKFHSAFGSNERMRVSQFEFVWANIFIPWLTKHHSRTIDSLLHRHRVMQPSC